MECSNLQLLNEHGRELNLQEIVENGPGIYSKEATEMNGGLSVYIHHEHYNSHCFITKHLTEWMLSRTELCMTSTEVELS